MSSYTIVTTGIVLSNALQNPATIVTGGQVTNTTGGGGGDGVYGFNNFAWTVANYGTINATAAYSDGIDLRLGGLVVNGTAGLIIGPDAVEISGAAGTVLNAGTIVSTDEYGVRLDNGGTVSNGTGSVGSAAIIGVNVGVLVLSGSVIVNGNSSFSAATISGATYGVRSLNAAASVTNFGTIVGTSGAGISLYSGGTVTNAATGIVSSSREGIQIRNAVGSVDNTGIVQSTNGYLGVSMYAGALTNRPAGTIVGGFGVQIGGQGAVVNRGTIAGTASNGFGVVFSQGGSVRNGSTTATDALISGTERGVTIYNVTGTVTNFATISASVNFGAAVYLHGGGRVTNQLGGLIEGGGLGINVANGAGTVANFGTVAGLNASGILFSAGGSIGNSGLIFGGNYGINLFGGAGTITNSGTIAAIGTGLRLAATTLTNTGTIVGTNGISIYFTGGINRLIANPGAVFSGNAFGNTVDDTLELAAGAVGTIAGFGSSFGGFERIAVDPSASWLLAGYNMLAAGTTLSIAGTLTSGGTLVANGAIGVGIGAALALDGAFGGSGTIDFPGVGGGILEIGGTTMPSNAITGVEPGDVFLLPDVPFDPAGSAVLRAGNVLRIRENGTNFDLQLGPSEDFTGKFFHLEADGGGTRVFEDTIPCFCRGTRIRTPSGEVPVEELAIGDRVETLSGQARRIRWIGRRAYDPRFVRGNRNILPVRVRAAALAAGVPARDLLISPEHALYLDGLFLPARHLVNGVTIRQPAWRGNIEYFHIELDSHDVIFAEGAAAETFVAFGGRGMFHNGVEFVALYPHDEPPDWPPYEALLERGKAGLSGVRARLLARAERLGMITRDPDMHLLVDGATVRALSIDGGIHRFALPANADDVRIASRSVVPAEMEVGSPDRRRLGVPVRRIVLCGAGRRFAIGPGCAQLRDGFHADEESHRWTDGDALLPPEVLAAIVGDLTLEVEIATTELRYPTGLAATGAKRFTGAQIRPSTGHRLTG